MQKGPVRLPRLDVPREHITVRPALSRDELEQAFRLVYASYRQRSYIPPHPSGVRLSPFNAFPGTVTFISMLQGQAVATVTLVPDTPVGLPMDEIYHEEAQALRDEGRRITEVTMLADRRRELRRALPMLLEMMKCVFDYATLVLGANDICITINPRHEDYYERWLLFRPLGGLKEYPSVRNNPALAKRLDLDTARAECEGKPDLIAHFFTDRTPVELLESAYRMTPDDLRYFFTELTDLFRTAPAGVIRCLEGCYPECPWGEWTAAASGPSTLK